MPVSSFSPAVEGVSTSTPSDLWRPLTLCCLSTTRSLFGRDRCRRVRSNCVVQLTSSGGSNGRHVQGEHATSSDHQESAASRWSHQLGTIHVPPHQTTDATIPTGIVCHLNLALVFQFLVKFLFSGIYLSAC